MKPPFRHADYVEMTVHFRCNLACKHCMILESMHWLQPAQDADFSALLQENKTHRKWKGLILTGSEVTLRKDLPDLAQRARQAGFEHVRIQTHGMRLADAGYCRQLVDAGIDEYFVSVTADEAQLHDKITEVPGSFERTLQGLQNLDELPVKIMTNTVVTRLSYERLVNIVDLLQPLKRLIEMDFWCYWPMKETDNTGLLVSHLETQPYLLAAISRAHELGRFVEVKNFPHCLMSQHAEVLRNDQPELRIDPEFWNEFSKNGFYQCVHRKTCESQQCLGLNTAYANTFGWHESELIPLTSLITSGS